MENYIKVRVIPKAPITEIYDIQSDGTYKIRIKDAPEKGKANKALLKYLSKVLSVPRTSIKIVTGAMSREKLIKVQGIKKEQLEFILSSVFNERKGLSN